jgi:hypothetical protein
MSLKWFDGFEADWTVGGSEPAGPGGYDAMAIGGGGGNSISTSFGRYGGTGARVSSSGGAAAMYAEKYNMGLGQEFLMQCSSVPFSGQTRTVSIMGVRTSAGARMVECWWNTNGDLLVYHNGGSTLAYTHPFPGNIHHFIEIKAKVHASAGYIIVRVDHVEVYNSGPMAVLPVANAEQLWIMNRYGTVNTTHNCYYDDFAFCAIDGVAPVAATADWLGDAREVRMNPTAAGNYQQFTPLSSTLVSNVDDPQLSDGDSTYNYESTVGEKDTFVMADLPTPVTVLGVRQKVSARKDDVGARSIKPVLRIGGTDYEGTERVLLEAYQTSHQFYPVSPATSVAWTESEVNGTEAGYKVQS